jgi:hypothetical protein
MNLRSPFLARSALLVMALSCASVRSAAPADAADAPSPCAAPEYRQFDFWVGKWEVRETVSGAVAGKSLVEKLYDGCAIRENFSQDGFSGGSLNHYGRLDHHWRQAWTDSLGTWRDFVGRIEDSKMVMTWSHPSRARPGVIILERMAFTPNPNGTVRQFSQHSEDDGKTWTENYDYTYYPVK